MSAIKDHFRQQNPHKPGDFVKVKVGGTWAYINSRDKLLRIKQDSLMLIVSDNYDDLLCEYILILYNGKLFEVPYSRLNVIEHEFF